MQRPTDDAPAPTATVYRVDDLTIDTARAVVTRNGAELPLPKLSFDLLVALVEAAPRVVSLDELLDTVWAGVVVSPETVAQRAKLLRDVLGDSSRSPRYVVAVRGRGYRLASPVEPLSNAGAPTAAMSADATGSPQALAPARWRPPARVIWLGGLLAIVLVSWLVVMQRREAVVEHVPAPPATPVVEKSVAVLPFASLGQSADGNVLAFGIAEAVLHQLANVPGLVVIARTSSFSLGTPPGDARDIGRRLDVHYLLEGSVQQDAGRLRVTAQLVDTRTGAHVWSIRFDEPRTDIFAVQDGIASQVTRALQVSVQEANAARLASRGTANFDAYLAYLQGRAQLATGRIAEAAQAVASFERAVQLDPTFAAAYASLAHAEVFAAEFSGAKDRTERFARVRKRALELVDKAIALDASCAPAYVERGDLLAYEDLASAEVSYREGLRLRPNDAWAYAGLAAVLFERPSQRTLALQMLERARRLDPLEPAHDVTKAVFVLYDQGDVQEADTLLRNLLQRRPDYVPALVRLGEVAWCCEANSPEAIELLERAIAADPGADWARRLLVRAYLDVGDSASARAVAREARSSNDLVRLPLLVYHDEWHAAADVAYGALDRRLVSPAEELIAALALRRHARLTGQYQRAFAALVALSGITWSSDDVPEVPTRPGVRIAGIGVVDMLQASGNVVHARALRQVLIEQMDAELREPGRQRTWYYFSMSAALALGGERDRAFTWLQQGVDALPLAHDATFILGDPAFDAMRNDPRFHALEQRLQQRRERGRAGVEALRAAGRVPRRG
jgi:TolB-like protein/DNA-binding winged helix-turn-helix (wHTH) protein/tetratricopeptide (TPR) repeat protein